MPQVCKVCSHPSRKVIDAALVEGRSVRELESIHNVSAGSLRRHAENHLPRAMAKAHPLAKVMVEEAANGHAIINQLRTEIAGIIAIPPSVSGTGAGGKAGRAASVQAIVASGSVVLPAHAPWLEAWLDEVCGFTPAGATGKHDAQVDAMVYALRDLQEPGGQRASVGGVVVTTKVA